MVAPCLNSFLYGFINFCGKDLLKENAEAFPCFT